MNDNKQKNLLGIMWDNGGLFEFCEILSEKMNFNIIYVPELSPFFSYSLTSDSDDIPSSA